MDASLTRAEFNEFVKRMEDEHTRQNKRIDECERSSNNNNKMLIVVERLAVSIETMQRELSEQGKRLGRLESKDGELWRKATGYVITAILGIIIGFIFKQIGL